MYQSGMAARQDAEKRAEEQMMGNKPIELQQTEQETARVRRRGCP